MRDVDALAHVVRAFPDPLGARLTNPVDDIASFDAELMLSDLIQVENRLARLKRTRKPIHANVRCLSAAKQPLKPNSRSGP